MHAIEKSLSLICNAKAATEVEDGIVIFQWEGAEKFLQFHKAIADFCWVAFVEFGIGLVQLFQDAFTIAVTGIKGVGVYVSFQPFCNITHVGISLLSVV